MTIDLGKTIDGKYRVVRHIGAGGMGTVFEGENVLIGRRVAIKLLHAQVASMPEFVERFEREARAAVRIGSPHVCDVLDLGHLPNGDRFIVMEYLEGQSLEDRLTERGRLTPQELAPIAFELLEGLGSMHAAGVVHRDLKPANIFLARARGGRGEVVKILDFGVAKLQPKPGELGAMTQTGAMMGTPLYMSPEQARGARDVDGRSDIYSASVIFYRALAGELPYSAQNLNELLFKIVLEDPRPIREIVPDVDPEFAEIVHRGLSRDLERRFVGARAYQEAIAEWGRAQGRRSLAFDVTLPTDPPPRAIRPSSPDNLVSSSSPSSPAASTTSDASLPKAVAAPPPNVGTVANSSDGARIAVPAVTPLPASDGVAAASSPGAASSSRNVATPSPSSPRGAPTSSPSSPRAPTSSQEMETVGPRAAERALGPAAGTPLSWSGTTPRGVAGALSSSPSMSSGSIPAASGAAASDPPSPSVPAKSTDAASFAATQASPSEPSLGKGVGPATPTHTPAEVSGASAALAAEAAARAAPTVSTNRGLSKRTLVGAAAALTLVGVVGFAFSRAGQPPVASAAAESATIDPSTDDPPSSATAASEATGNGTGNTTGNGTSPETNEPSTASTAEATATATADTAADAGARATATGPAHGGNATPPPLTAAMVTRPTKPTPSAPPAATTSATKPTTSATAAATTSPAPAPTAPAPTTTSTSGRRFRTNLD